MKALKVLGWIVLVVVAVVAALRFLWLPGFLKRKVNAELASMQYYRGHVDGVDLAVFRGDVRLESLTVWDSSDDIHVDIPAMDVDWDWGPLFHHTVVSRVFIREPKVLMKLKKPTKEAKVVKEEAKNAKAPETLVKLMTGLMPFRMDSISVQDGTILLEGLPREGESAPGGEPAEARISDVQAVLKDLTNKKRDGKDVFAHGEASGRLARGTLLSHLKLDPMAHEPTFDMDLQVEGVQLLQLEPLTRWLWDINITSGTFALYLQTTASGGSFQGYVKPMLKDLRVTPVKKPTPAKLVKETIVGLLGTVLKNPKTHAAATEVRFGGKFDDPKIGVFQAIEAALVNAFVKALPPGLSGK